MTYALVFINAIVVALMAVYVYQNERRMEELSAKNNQTDEVLAFVTNRLEHLEIEKKRLEDDLKTRTLIPDDTLKGESVKVDDKCFRLEDKCVRLFEDKYASLERSNIELVLEVDRIKESIASQINVGPTNTITQVGFTAVLTKSTLLGPHQTIIYDKAITNIGEGYDIRHGHFSAPVRGLYLISATVLSGIKGDIRTEIMRENEQLAAMFCTISDMGSHTVIVFLKQKEQVWVRHFHEPTYNTVHSGKDRYYSSFSGVLIAAS